MKLDSQEGLSDLLFLNLNSDLFDRKRSIYKELGALSLPSMKSQKRANFILLSNFESVIKFTRRAIYDIFVFNKPFIHRAADKSDFVKLYELIYHLSNLSGVKELTLAKAKKIYLENKFPSISFNDNESIHGAKMINGIDVAMRYLKHSDDKLKEWITANTADRHYIAHGNEVLLNGDVNRKIINIDFLTNIIEDYYWIINKLINKFHVVSKKILI